MRLKAAPLDIPDFVAVLDAPAGSNLSEAAGEPWSLCLPDGLAVAAAPWEFGQQQLGAEWGDDQEFGGQGDIMDFLASEEQDCLQANHFIKEVRSQKPRPRH